MLKLFKAGSILFFSDSLDVKGNAIQNLGKARTQLHSTLRGSIVNKQCSNNLYHFYHSDSVFAQQSVFAAIGYQI